MKYDSTDATLKHIYRVQELLLTFQAELTKRAIRHDYTKLIPPEKPVFDKHTPKLKSSTYGGKAGISKEYRKNLKDLGEALEHHWSCHRHHPQHHKNGMHDMTLIDLVEMFCDWKAASERHDNGSMAASIKAARKRFKIHKVNVEEIFENTRSQLGWS